jgi:transcriptional regulator
MYSFPYFKTDNPEEILAFMREHPFAFIVGSFQNGEQVATQIPLLIEEKEGELYLQGHFMKGTNHHHVFIENANALVVFTGPHAYISASWYENQSMSSTWNYMSVQINGNLRFMEDEELIQFMQKLSLHFEDQQTNSPTVFENLPTEMRNSFLKAIIGFEIKTTKIDHTFKLSQNRDEKSYQNIIEKLEEKGGTDALVALEMRKRKK